MVIVAIGQNDNHPIDYMKEDYDCEQSKNWRSHYKQFIQKLDFVPSTVVNRTAWKNALDVFEHVTVLLNDGKLLIYK